MRVERARKMIRSERLNKDRPARGFVSHCEPHGSPPGFSIGVAVGRRGEPSTFPLYTRSTSQMSWKPNPVVAQLTPVTDGVVHDFSRPGAYGVVQKVADKTPVSISQGAIFGDVVALAEVSDGD